MTDVPMTYIQNVLYAIHFALGRKTWVVIVCPDALTTQQCQTVMSAAVPPDAICGGRTILLPNGSKISVVCGTQPTFVPEDEDHYTLFVGWRGKESLRQSTWYQSPQMVLRAEIQ